MEAIRELGLLEQEPVEVNGHRVAPRDVAIAAMAPRLTKPQSHDLVALRVEATGTKGGKPTTIGFELIDRYDETHGISAMMRTTGYSLAITGLLQAAGRIAPGVNTPDECMPAAEYIAELAKRGVMIRQYVR
jgi:lysine 6-dehydrogenase